MDTTVDTALATPRGVAVPTGRNEGRFATALIAAVPFVIAWIGLVTTQLGQRSWYSDEDGLAENLQVVFLLLATLGAGVVARAHWERGRRALAVAYLGLAVACFFVAGEEISWGQRLLGFETPRAIAAQNVQQEITLHNTFLLTPVFSLAQLVLGFGLTLAALVPWSLLLSPRLDALRRALVPGPALAGYFAMSAAWRLYRYVGLTPSTPAWVGELSEVPELILYLGLALFTLDQVRALREPRSP
jgi:hypothetical protein